MKRTFLSIILSVILCMGFTVIPVLGADTIVIKHELFNHAPFSVSNVTDVVHETEDYDGQIVTTVFIYANAPTIVTMLGEDDGMMLDSGGVTGGLFGYGSGGLKDTKTNEFVPYTTVEYDIDTWGQIIIRAGSTFVLGGLALLLI